MQNLDDDANEFDNDDDDNGDDNNHDNLMMKRTVLLLLLQFYRVCGWFYNRLLRFLCMTMYNKVDVFR